MPVDHRYAIPVAQIPRRQAQGSGDHSFGDFRKVIAYNHQRDHPGNVGGGDAQDVGLFELAQGRHLLFRVTGGETF